MRNYVKTGAKRGPKPSGKAMTSTERSRKKYGLDGAQLDQDIAVIDFETDPFDRDTQAIVRPFLAVMCSKQFDDVVIWEEDYDAFVSKVLAAIEALPRKFTVYAHNGGKFDYMFLVHKLRGDVMFKGRGIMSARVGAHELRDSFHIIPEKLASYKKDAFDYSTLTKDKRHALRSDIIRYCLHDCEYLLDIVLSFVQRYGRKISIGQAASSAVKSSGIVVEKLNDNFDAYLRNFYFGGRVECLAGIGHFVSRPGHQYKLYDVNSMYPTAMRDFQHPIGGPNDYVIRTKRPGPNTVFLDITCDNYGALVKRGADGETSTREGRGRYWTTIWEYDAALELGLIDNITFHNIVDCGRRSDFASFVVPTYEARMDTKARLRALKLQGLDEQNDEYADAKKDDMFLKFLLNNAYGKYAQNPRRFKEAYITNIGERPVELESKGFKCCDEQQPIRQGLAVCDCCGKSFPAFGALPRYENKREGYAIWERPQKRLGFNNVGTAASITGAARAMLMRGIASAVDPIYCDTDSIICADLSGVPISATELGAWDIEDTYEEVIVAGKKLYACNLGGGKYKYRMKGGEGAVWADYHAMLDAAFRENAEYHFTSRSKGPTMTRTGAYSYMTRHVRATGPKVGNIPLLSRKRA